MPHNLFIASTNVILTPQSVQFQHHFPQIFIIRSRKTNKKS